MKEGNTFSKQERLCGNKQVDRLFARGNRQVAAFPVRLVWHEVDEPHGIRLLISAPKRNFHHAVDRNRIKRQIREFYRTSSAQLKETVNGRNKGLDLAILFTDNKLWETSRLHERMAAAFDKLVQTLSQTASDGVEQTPE